MTQSFADSWMQWESFGVTNYPRVFQMPAWAPDPCFLIGGDLMIEGGVPLNSRPLLLNDPGGVYTKVAWGQTGLPAGQITELPTNALTANRLLRRIVVLDTARNTRQLDEHIVPIRHSRSEGDFIWLDKTSSDPAFWFIHTLMWHNVANYGGIQPPAFAYGTGSWAMTGNGSAGTGRTVSRNVSGHGNMMFGFTAPANGEVSMIQFRADALTAQGNIIFQLYTDVGGKPGTALGGPSWTWFVGSAGEQMPQWPVGGGGATVAGNRYCLVGTPDTSLNMDVDTHVGVPTNTYTSGWGDTISNINNNLPNGEIWRMLVTAIVT